MIGCAHWLVQLPLALAWEELINSGDYVCGGMAFKGISGQWFVYFGPGWIPCVSS